MALLYIEMQFVVIMLVGTVEHVFGRDVVVNVNTQNNRSLVSPASRYILDSVASSSQNNSRNTKSKHVVYAFSMALHRQVEVPQSIL